LSAISWRDQVNVQWDDDDDDDDSFVLEQHDKLDFYCPSSRFAFDCLTV